MKDKPSLLAELMAEHQSITVENETEFTPKKKRDFKDSRLGVLPMFLQKLWILRERYRQTTDYIIEKVDNLMSCFCDDLMHNEGDVPEWIKSEYSSKLKDLLKEAKPSYRKFRAADRCFFSLVEMEFDRDPSMPIFGIREHYTVICREDNARKDKYNPLEKLLSNLDFTGKKLVVSKIAIELPKGVDPSSLPPREILRMILKTMDEEEGGKSGTAN